MKRYFSKDEDQECFTKLVRSGLSIPEAVAQMQLLDIHPYRKPIKPRRVAHDAVFDNSRFPSQDKKAELPFFYGSRRY